jgi:hypothetical protein
VESGHEPGTGSCKAVVTDCSSIADEDTCLTTGAAGNKTCFWLNDINIMTYGGKCKDKTDKDLQCWDVADITECSDNDKLGGTTLEGKCDIYNEVCKTRCDELTSETTETCSAGGNRSDDCFEVKNSDGTFKECVDLVC